MPYVKKLDQTPANRNQHKKDTETDCYRHLALCSQRRRPNKHHDKTRYQNSQSNDTGGKESTRRLPPFAQGGQSMASAASFSTGSAHAQDFDDPMADFIYAECQTNKWYSQGEADAHCRLLSVSLTRSG